MNGGDRRVDLDPHRYPVPAELERLLADDSPHPRDHGLESQRLLDHRIQIRAVPRRGRGPQPLEDGRCCKHSSSAQARPVAVVSWPATSSVTELVPQLPRRHPFAVLVAGQKEHGEDVLALGQVGGVAAPLDLFVDQLVERPPAFLEPLPGPTSSARRRAPARSTRCAWRSGRSWPDPSLELIESRPRVDPEDGPQDHVERERERGGGETVAPPARESIARSAASRMICS